MHVHVYVYVFTILYYTIMFYVHLYVVGTPLALESALTKSRGLVGRWETVHKAQGDLLPGGFDHFDWVIYDEGKGCILLFMYSVCDVCMYTKVHMCTLWECVVWCLYSMYVYCIPMFTACLYTYQANISITYTHILPHPPIYTLLPIYIYTIHIYIQYTLSTTKKAMPSSDSYGQWTANFLPCPLL